jgi:hypothetical protein
VIDRQSNDLCDKDKMIQKVFGYVGYKQVQSTVQQLSAWPLSNGEHQTILHYSIAVSIWSVNVETLNRQLVIEYQQFAHL